MIYKTIYLRTEIGTQTEMDMDMDIGYNVRAVTYAASATFHHTHDYPAEVGDRA